MGEAAAAEVLDRALHLTAPELAALAAAGTRSSGRMGMDLTWGQACQSVLYAARVAGRMDACRQATADALLAVLDSGLPVGLDRTDVYGAVGAYLEADQAGDGNQLAEETRRLQRTLKRSVGSSQAKALRAASLAVRSAAVALLTWDLVDGGIGYTTVERAILLEPWAAVLPVPTAPDG